MNKLKRFISSTLLTIMLISIILPLFKIEVQAAGTWTPYNPLLWRENSINDDYTISVDYKSLKIDLLKEFSMGTAHIGDSVYNEKWNNGQGFDATVNCDIAGDITFGNETSNKIYSDYDRLPSNESIGSDCEESSYSLMKKFI